MVLKKTDVGDLATRSDVEAASRTRQEELGSLVSDANQKQLDLVQKHLDEKKAAKKIFNQKLKATEEDQMLKLKQIHGKLGTILPILLSKFLSKANQEIQLCSAIV